jgi:hypothetical protein
MRHINLLREEIERYAPPEPVKMDKDAWLVFLGGLASLITMFTVMILFG